MYNYAVCCRTALNYSKTKERGFTWGRLRHAHYGGFIVGRRHAHTGDGVFHCITTPPTADSSWGRHLPVIPAHPMQYHCWICARYKSISSSCCRRCYYYPANAIKIARFVPYHTNVRMTGNKSNLEMCKNAVNFVKIVHTSRPWGANLWTKFQIWRFWGCTATFFAPITVKFGTWSGSVPNFMFIGAMHCPCGGEKRIIPPLSKRNTGMLPCGQACR